MNLNNDHLIQLYTLMVRTRKFDELMVQGIAEGKLISFFHSGQGEEAVGVGGCTFTLKDDDYLYPHHRGHMIGFYLARGISPKYFVAGHYGKSLPEKPEGPTMEERGIFGLSGTIGGGFVLALGWGIAAQKNKKDQVTACFFGDGASGRGTLHEAMNMASVWNLPIVWICENNQYGQWMPIKEAYAREDIADLAAGYNMPGVVVDGQDVLAVHEAVQAAVDRARAGNGPSLVECKTYRYRPHVEGTPDLAHADSRPAEEMEAWLKRDPINLFREKLLKQGVMNDVDVERIDKETDTEVEELDKLCLESPKPPVEDPSILDKMLYAE